MERLDMAGEAGMKAGAEEASASTGATESVEGSGDELFESSRGKEGEISSRLGSGDGDGEGEGGSDSSTTASCIDIGSSR
jgi:hypothetical protein